MLQWAALVWVTADPENLSLDRHGGEAMITFLGHLVSELAGLLPTHVFTLTIGPTPANSHSMPHRALMALQGAKKENREEENKPCPFQTYANFLTEF